MSVLARAAAMKKWPCSKKPLSVGRLSASSFEFELLAVKTKADCVAYVPSAVTNCWTDVVWLLLRTICSSSLFVSMPAARLCSSSNIGKSHRDWRI